MVKRRTLALNTKGFRVGEDHQRAKLTDHEVDLIRSLHREGLTYKTIAEKFEISARMVGAICRYERRAEVVTAYKSIEVNP